MARQTVIPLIVKQAAAEATNMLEKAGLEPNKNIFLLIAVMVHAYADTMDESVDHLLDRLRRVQMIDQYLDADEDVS